MRTSGLCWLLLVTTMGCGSGDEDVEEEGEIPFSCQDGADNDGDGLFDCDDPGCAGSPDCEEPPETAQTGGTGTPPPDPPCLQEDALDLTLVDIQVTPAPLDAMTLAFAGSQTPTGALPVGLADTDYLGAIDPGATEWWRGWTYTNSELDGNLPQVDVHPLADDFGSDIIASSINACAQIDGNFADGGTVTIGGEDFPVCIVTGRIAVTQTWPNNHVFLLEGTVTVGDGDASGGTPNAVTLTLQAGIQVYAVDDTETSLVISRGSEIEAVGTADLPVIFGAVEANTGNVPAITDDPTDLRSRGKWSGIVLSGYGQLNNGDANNERLSSWVPNDGERYFGGDDNSDSSGLLRYVVVAEAGIEVGQQDNAPALLLEAAGSGTTLEYVQVIASEGDGIAFVGGAASGRYLLSQGSDDDGLDFDSGYVGNLQNVLVMLGDTNGDRGIESDNAAPNFDATPRTDPNLANVTVVGNAGTAPQDTVGMLLREGATVGVYRSLFTEVGTREFEAGCLDIDDQLPSDLNFVDVLFDCSPESITCDDDSP